MKCQMAHNPMISELHNHLFEGPNRFMEIHNSIYEMHNSNEAAP